MNCTETISKEELVKRLPQKYPFKFVDEILEVDESRIVGAYQYRKDEYFYQGHYPDFPITPGVILIETMGQVGIAAYGIYLDALKPGGIGISNCHLVITDVTVEFLLPVFPEDRVIIRAEKVFVRMRKIRSKIEMYRGDDLVAACTASGVGVPK